MLWWHHLLWSIFIRNVYLVRGVLAFKDPKNYTDSFSQCKRCFCSSPPDWLWQCLVKHSSWWLLLQPLTQRFQLLFVSSRYLYPFKIWLLCLKRDTQTIRPINRLGNIPSAVPGALMTSSWLLFALQWSAGKRKMGRGGRGKKKTPLS